MKRAGSSIAILAIIFAVTGLFVSSSFAFSEFFGSGRQAVTSPRQEEIQLQTPVQASQQNYHIYLPVALSPPPSPPEMYTAPVAWSTKGAALVAYWHDSYAQANAFDLVDYLLESGVDTIQIVPSWFQSNMQSHDIAPDADRSPTDDSVGAIIDYIHEKGAKVMLKPHLEPRQGWTGAEGGWRGVVSPTSRALWFDNYEAFILHYAELAQSKNVEIFVMGTEMASMTQGEANQRRWHEMLGHVRQVYTSGAVTYAAHEYGVMGGYYREPVDPEVPAVFEMSFAPLPPSFWAPFDYAATTIYYDIYSPAQVTGTDVITPSVEVLLDGWYKNDVSDRPPNQAYLVDTLSRWQASHGKPVIFAEIGYRSIDHCAFHPFVATPGEANGPGLSANYNDLCQANAYEAALAIWGGKPWLAGAFWWQLVPRVANARECGGDVASAAEVSYTPCGRAAAGVMSRWYDGAQAPPAPPPAYVPNLPLLLNLDTWDEPTIHRALRTQTSGDIAFTLDQDIHLAAFSQSLQMTSTIPCNNERYGQLDFTFTTPQDFSQYKSISLTARTRQDDQGELSVVLIDADGEEWQSTNWLAGSDWQTFKISLTQGESPIDDPWAHPYDFVIPEWVTETHNLTLDLTGVQSIRIKGLTTTCEEPAQMVVWFGDMHLSPDVVTPPTPVAFPVIDAFDYASDAELSMYWKVMSTSGETSIGLDRGALSDDPPALRIENNLPCQENRHALITRKFLRPVDFSNYTRLTVRVSGDGLSYPPYGGEFSVVLWDAGSDEWEEWQSTRWYARNGGWQTFTIQLQGAGVGDPWQHPDDFVIPDEWAIPRNGHLDLDKIAAIGLKANTTNDGCASDPSSLVLIDDIVLETGE